MPSRERFGCDYAADVYESCDVVTKSIQEAFEKKWDLVTRSAPCQCRTFISSTQRLALYRAVLERIPAGVRWSATEIGPHRTRVQMTFEFPRALHLRACLFLLLIYGVNFLVRQSLSLWMGAAGPDGYIAVHITCIVVYVLAGLITMVVAWYLLIFLSRYIDASDVLLRDIARNLGCEHDVVPRSSTVRGHRFWMDPWLVVLAVGLFLLANGDATLMREIGTWSLRSPLSKSLLICVVPTLLLVVAISQASIRGSFTGLRALPAATGQHFALTMALGICSAKGAHRLGLQGCALNDQWAETRGRGIGC
jgi:hypothetical protein